MEDKPDLKSFKMENKIQEKAEKYKKKVYEKATEELNSFEFYDKTAPLPEKKEGINFEVKIGSIADLTNFSNLDEKERKHIVENEKKGIYEKNLKEVAKRISEKDMNKVLLMEVYTTNFKEAGKELKLTKEEEKKLEETFLSDTDYQIIDNFYDKDSHVRGLVLKNKTDDTTEIIYSGSGDFKDIKTWSKNLSTTLYGKDKSQDVALKIAQDVEKKYGKLVKVNGHSKGGGEAINTASHMKDVSFFVEDPLNVTKLGPYPLGDRGIALVPNNGNSALNKVVKTKGNIYALVPKLGFSQKEYSDIIAFPIKSMEKEKNVEKESNAEKLGSYLKTKDEYLKNKTNFKGINKIHVGDSENSKEELTAYLNGNKNPDINKTNNRNNENLNDGIFLASKEDRGLLSPNIRKSRLFSNLQQEIKNKKIFNSENKAKKAEKTEIKSREITKG